GKWDDTAIPGEYLPQRERRVKRPLRLLLRLIDFADPAMSNPWMKAISFVTEALHTNKSQGQYANNRLPSHFTPDNIKRYVYKQEPGGERVISVNRYEFLLYRLLRDRLEAGDIFCRESIRFRSFEDDLIDDHQWQEKEKLLAET